MEYIYDPIKIASIWMNDDATGHTEITVLKKSLQSSAVCVY